MGTERGAGSNRKERSALDTEAVLRVSALFPHYIHSQTCLCLQGAMSISEAMMIPPQFNPTLSPGHVGRAQQMNMPTNVPPVNKTEGNWNGSNWPVLNGRATGLSMGTSPFGRSVDMVDMATQLMEAGGGAKRDLSTHACPQCMTHLAAGLFFVSRVRIPELKFVVKSYSALLVFCCQLCCSLQAQVVQTFC